jgi:hypothetical protein
VYASVIARQRLGNHVPAARSTLNSKRIVGRVVFSSECKSGFLPFEPNCLVKRYQEYYLRYVPCCSYSSVNKV